MDIELYYTPNTHSSGHAGTAGIRNPAANANPAGKTPCRCHCRLRAESSPVRAAHAGQETAHGGHLLGKSFCCADVMFGTTLAWLPDSLAPFAALQDYVARVTARPANRRALQPVPDNNRR
ncbi:MAG: hypothetical protein WBQ78_10900 [Gammaproteobacteria bacterium]